MKHPPEKGIADLNISENPQCPIYHGIVVYNGANSIILDIDDNFTPTYNTRTVGNWTINLISSSGADLTGRVKTVEDRWLCVDEVASYLGVKRDTVYKWIERKGLPAHKLGRLWKFRRNEIDEWVFVSEKRSWGAKSIA